MTGGLPRPDDFPAPPGEADLRRWAEADAAARPARISRVRTRLVEAGLDGYFGLRPEHSRYLTGFALGNGEEKVAGDSGRFLVTGEAVILLADSRYTQQAAREAPLVRVEMADNDLPARWAGLLASAGVRRLAVEANAISHGLWERLAAAAPDVELVAVDGWIEADRAVKEPSEVERVSAACGVADRALAAILPAIRPGRTERAVALDLEWAMRTGGAEALAFDIACLAGPEAALPHGSPGDRPVRSGAVLLFDFGAQVAGYRSDMTRTLFVGEPTPRDLAIYELVAKAQAAAIETLKRRVGSAAGDESPIPSGREIDGVARRVIEAAGLGEHFGHGLGHGIGLATHELPSLGRRAPESPLPSPTVFSVEPGVYLPGETGVRIEDLVALDAAAGTVRRLTNFPREVLVLDA